jgi:hypothetical protein
MELAPANVEGHCSTPITYVDGIGSIGIDWMFNMVPRIVADESPVNAIALASIPMVIDFPANFPENFGFSPNLTFEHLPWNSVVGPLIAHVESRSDARRVGNSGNTENLRFADCTDYSIFPKILYSFYNRQEGIYRHRYHRKVDVILYPEDFVDIVTGSDGTSYCNLHIRISAETENYGTIGSNLIRAVPTHLDSANGVIGFCDPQ